MKRSEAFKIVSDTFNRAKTSNVLSAKTVEIEAEPDDRHFFLIFRQDGIESRLAVRLLMKAPKKLSAIVEVQPDCDLYSLTLSQCNTAIELLQSLSSIGEHIQKKLCGVTIELDEVAA